MGGCAPQSNVDALKAASRQFDIDTGQNPNYDAAHSMAQPGETLQDFFNQRSDWINSNMWNAEAAEKAGNLNTALTDLAQAMHTVEDAYSPMHMLGGPNGIPYVWDCSAPFGGNFKHCFKPGPNKPWNNNWRHGLGSKWGLPDWWGGETVGVWNDEPASVKNAVRLDLLNAYQAVFGPCQNSSGRKN